MSKYLSFSLCSIYTFLDCRNPEDLGNTLKIYQLSRYHIPKALIPFQLLQVTVGVEKLILVCVHLYSVCDVILFAFSTNGAQPQHSITHLVMLLSHQYI
jgi:hypothetical protein